MSSRSLLATCVLMAALPVSGLAAVAEPDAPLAEAAMRRDISAVRELFSKKADVNATGPDGTTALEWMIRIDDLEISKMLLAAGADPKKANRLGVTPIALAAANGNVDILKILLDAGVDANTITKLNPEIDPRALQPGQKLKLK